MAGLKLPETLGVETLEKKLGRRIKRLRQTLGQSRTIFSAAIGIKSKYLHDIEDGKMLCTREVARRVVLWAWEGYNWKDHPTLPAQLLAEQSKWNRPSSLYKQEVLKWPDTPLYREHFDKLQEAADTLGLSRSAVIMLAVDRLCQDAPTMFTIREGAGAYERLRKETVREWFPEVVPILDGDASVAKAIHTALAKQERLRQVGGALGPVSVLDSWSLDRDGPATPVAPMPPRGWRKSPAAKNAETLRKQAEDED